MSACSRGSERSRPDSQARQNICAGPMIWLKNTVGVIGSNSPRATSGARHRSHGFGETRILRTLRAADLLGPFAARYLEQIARLAPGVDDPVEMGADQPRDALPRAAGFI